MPDCRRRQNHLIVSPRLCCKSACRGCDQARVLRGGSHARFLPLFKYSAEGAKGFLKEKAAAREAAARKAESLGGTPRISLQSANTGIAISELPDAATGAAFIAMVQSTGSFSEFKTIELLTASEIDRALGKSMTYRPPGT